MKEIKLAVIGGGSSYTPELLHGLIDRWKNGEFLAKEISLIDVPEGIHRMEIVSAFAERMLKIGEMPSTIRASTNLREGLDDADFVVSQIRVGGMKARQTDEQIPVKYGMVGQETTGPGGFANALRTVPVALGIAHEMESICPKAWLLNFTNPSGIITEALIKHSKTKVFGLCNVPIGIKMAIAKSLDVQPSRIGIDVSGLNHLSFVTRVYLDSEDITAQVVSSPFMTKYLEDSKFDRSFSRLMKSIEVIPAAYLYYYWARNRSIQSQKRSIESKKGTRATEVMKVEKKLFEMYQDKDLDYLPPELKKRGGAYYSDVALNAVSCIVQNRSGIEVLNVQNKGAVPWLAKDTVVEVSCAVNGFGPKPIAQNPLPIEVLGLVQKVKAYEMLTIEAAVTGNFEKAHFALMNHPLVQDSDDASRLLNDIIEQNSEYLPLFKGKTVQGL